MRPGRSQPNRVRIVRPVLLGDFVANVDATIDATVTASDATVSTSAIPQLGQVFNFTGTMRRGGHFVVLRTEAPPVTGVNPDLIDLTVDANDPSLSLSPVSDWAAVQVDSLDATVLQGGSVFATEATAQVDSNDATTTGVSAGVPQVIVVNATALRTAFALRQLVVDPAIASAPLPFDVVGITPVLADVVGTAFDTTTTNSAGSIPSTGQVDAPDASVSLGVPTTQADGTVAAQDATVTQPAPLTQVFPPVIDVTGAANDPQIPISAPADETDVTVAANDATTTNSGLTNAQSTEATVTVTAPDATGNAQPNAAAATSVVDAGDPDAYPGVPGLNAPVTVAAFDTTITSASHGDADAFEATGSTTAYDAGANASIDAAGEADGTVAANAATILTNISTAANAGLADTTNVANDGRVDVIGSATEATVTGSAGDGDVLDATTTSPDFALTAAAAYDAAVALEAAADFAFAYALIDDLQPDIVSNTVAALVTALALDAKAFHHRRGHSRSAVVQVSTTNTDVTPTADDSGVN